MMRIGVFAVTIVLALSSCARVPAKRGPASDDPAIETITKVPLQSQTEIEKIIEETNPVLAEMSADSEKVPLQIPLEINQNVAEWIKFFTVRERERTQRYLERGEALRPHIEQILKDNDVPSELYYLAMIESGFVAHAKSHASAVGVWQFMKGTGKNYGLAVNSSVDERRNWIKATEAAASYLKDLNNVFGSWYLALAAYNAGEHRIVRSIMKGKTRDFWALAEAGLLPKETLNYVPKFLAAQIVGKNMARYGFKVEVDPANKWEEFESISVPSGVKLTDLAKTCDVPHDTLKRWNQDLLRGITPYDKSGSVEIYVPKAVVASIEGKRTELARLKKHRTGNEEQRVYASSKGSGGDYAIYVVGRGETLSGISRRLGVSVRTLMKINGLRRSRIHPGQRLKHYGSPSATAQKGKSASIGKRGLASEKRPVKKSKSRRIAKK